MFKTEQDKLVTLGLLMGSWLGMCGFALIESSLSPSARELSFFVPIVLLLIAASRPSAEERLSSAASDRR